MGRRTVNKTRFIVSFPLDTPAKEIRRAGKARGIHFHEAYVYRARSIARQQLAPGPVAVDGDASWQEAPEDAHALRSLILKLGLTRSRELLEEVEAILHALIGA